MSTCYDSACVHADSDSVPHVARPGCNIDSNGARHTAETAQMAETQLDRIEQKLDVLVEFVNTAGAALADIQSKGIGGMMKMMMGGGAK